MSDRFPSDNPAAKAQPGYVRESELGFLSLAPDRAILDPFRGAAKTGIHRPWVLTGAIGPNLDAMGEIDAADHHHDGDDNLDGVG